MPGACSRCKRQLAKSDRRLCRDCQERWEEGRHGLELPAGHPFTLARLARLERMAERASRGEPVCEPVAVDLS